MKVHISDHFTYSKIFHIVIFPIIMMVFTSLYTIVDGIFIANFASSSSFAAVNLVFPLIMIVGSIGFMMGTGGTALVSKFLGEKDQDKANSAFSLIVYSTFIIGLIISIAGFFSIEPIVKAFGDITPSSTEEMVHEAIIYGRILILAQSLFMLQNMFQSFMMVAERPRLGFIFTIAGGVTNIIFDAIFVGALKLGVVGAAIATILGYAVASIGPLIYFIVKRNGIICLGRAKVEFKIIGKAAYNGMSEFISNISGNIVAIIYNAQLLKAYGENGVSAYGIIMYVSFVFIAIFIGYSMGLAPVVGYNYGARNTFELNNVLKKSLMIVLIMCVSMFAFGYLTARPFSHIFSNGNEELAALSTKAMKIYSISFLAIGFSIYISSFFTALNNGTVSAINSVLRTAVFQVACLFLLPNFLGNDGIWWAIVVGELLAALNYFMFLWGYKKRYGY